MSETAIPGFGTPEFLRFVLVAARCIAMFAVMPVFSSSMIPVQMRIGLSLITAFFISQTLPVPPVMTAIPLFMVAVATQTGIGLLIGFVSSFVFYGIQFAGEIVDTQVGFAISNIINPLTGTQVTLLGQFQMILATLIFLASDSHLTLLEGLAGSFRLVPLPFAVLPPQVMGDVMHLFSMSLMIVFKIAAPVAVSLFVTNIAFALLTRVAPQINVFVVGLPAQLGLGLTMFMLGLPIFGYVVPAMFRSLPTELDTLLRLLGPAH